MLTTASLSALPGGGMSLLAGDGQEETNGADQEALAHQRQHQEEAARDRIANQEDQAPSIIERSDDSSGGFRESDSSNQMPLSGAAAPSSVSTPRKAISFEFNNSPLMDSRNAVTVPPGIANYAAKVGTLCDALRTQSQQRAELGNKGEEDAESIHLSMDGDHSSEWSQERNDYSARGDWREEETKTPHASTTSLKTSPTTLGKMATLLDDNEAALLSYRIAAAAQRYRDLPLKKMVDSSSAVQIIPVSESDPINYGITARDFYERVEACYGPDITEWAFWAWPSQDDAGIDQALADEEAVSFCAADLFTEACHSGLTREIIRQVLRQADLKKPN